MTRVAACNFTFERTKKITKNGTKLLKQKFSFQMRKHLKNKRLVSLKQLGIDRIVDLEFGSNEAAYHVILELYDRGNVVLTDHQFNILYLSRRHLVEKEQLQFAIKERYPVDRAKENQILNEDRLREVLLKEWKEKGGKGGGTVIKRILLKEYEFGPSLIEHSILKCGFNSAIKLGGIDLDIEKNEEETTRRIFKIVLEANELFLKAKENSLETKGFLIKKKEIRFKNFSSSATSTSATGKETDTSLEEDFVLINEEFHPMLFLQNSSSNGGIYVEFESFNLAIDEFFSNIESERIDKKLFAQEREAMKKLENVRQDHKERLKCLEELQEEDRNKGEIIIRNQRLVDAAILCVQRALASQVSLFYLFLKFFLYFGVSFVKCRNFHAISSNIS